MKETYKKQVQLLLSVLEITLSDKRFALKGGTAINLFYRNFPRYSVDVDLTYLPIEDRKTTFTNIHEILKTITQKLKDELGLEVFSSRPLDGKSETKLFVSNTDVQIKIEPNFILRGSLFPVKKIKLCEKASAEFEMEVSVNCLSIEDVYGEKICAALDRQHPRDLFDIKNLFDNEGITEGLKDTFIFYLISHNRPIHELLNPNLKDISSIYESEFKNMAEVKVELIELNKVRKQLVAKIKDTLNENDIAFLKSFVANKPDWNLVKNNIIQNYPSVKWKLLNQKNMDSKKKEKYINDVSLLFEQ